ncbi:MAG: glycosyltransferase [Actinomycetota bacterium]
MEQNASNTVDQRSVGERTSVIVVPRQRWSLAVRSLEAVLAELPEGAQLVYVDGGSPDEIRRQLQTMVEAAGGVWIHRDCILTGNEGRNMAMEFVDREFVVSVDNDVIPHPGWIDRMVECADETGAGVVGPLIFHGPKPESANIHIAGGAIEIHDGVMTTNDRHHSYLNVDQVEDQLERRETTQLEFHTIMIRADLIREIGGFDENLITFGDHEDLTLAAIERGVGVWFEPAARITYLTMIALDENEIGYWQLRWCEEWNRTSLEHFGRKWKIETSSGWPVTARLWGTRERTRWYHGRNKLYKYGGLMVRGLNKKPATAKMSRHLEERLMSRRTDAEVQRRVDEGLPVPYGPSAAVARSAA